MLKKPKQQQRLLLVGLESVGKTTLFSAITDQQAGEETNVKGSTVFVTEREIKSLQGWVVVDAPGLRPDDSLTQRALKREIEKADHTIVVLRGTHFSEELQTIIGLIPPECQHVYFIVTFKDKMTREMRLALSDHIERYDLPVMLIDSRRMTESKKERLFAFLRKDASFHPLKRKQMECLKLASAPPRHMWFDHRIWGPLLSLTVLCVLFMLPVIAAYHVSGWGQQYADEWLIDPLKKAAEGWPSWLGAIFAGNYGLFTLGIYSFVWAFPVVLFMSAANAAADDSGLKDRIVDSLDPLMRKIGMNGQDLVPLITGFGCNVVAVQQTRSCSICTRRQCVSMISFGSACSYQIGASLSIFHAGGKEWLFIPYLLTLVTVGAVHNRFWYPSEQKWSSYFKNRASFLQRPSWKGTAFRVKTMLKQFMFQAMPIFFIICLAATVLHELGIIRFFTMLVSPVLKAFGAPAEAAPGLVFSMIRKDGILLFNEDGGALLHSLSGGTLFLLVYLASTFSACMVTVLTIAKELGMKAAAGLVGKQMVTAAVSALALLCIWKLLFS
ncbi:50S ribosome-binding GTPase [Bacillus sonorensis]|uniref:nucleoside recognition domain-containing protein n=1 Tax=Bacillus sonorensis TaxID=119858 RepID=UPI001F009DC7|nr:nucleoside recognition domain-containing protein [Bacillus sonorensis]MCF7616972.1 50S ribosome-binding GTPase [Bacillus sonorensis]